MDPTQTAETFYTIEPVLFYLVASLTALCAIATVVTQNIVRAATWLLFALAGTSAAFFLLGADLVGVTQLLVYVGGTLVLVIFGVMLTAQGPFITMKTSGAEWAISVVAGMLLFAVLTTAVMSEHVQLGPPQVRLAVHFPGENEPRKTLTKPEVKQFAPEYSRFQREAIAAERSTKNIARPMGGVEGGTIRVAGKGSAKDEGNLTLPAGDDFLALNERYERDQSIAAIDPATSPGAVVLGEGFMGVGVGPAHNTSERRLLRTSYLLPFEIVSVHLLVVLIGAAYLARAKRRRGGES